MADWALGAIKASDAPPVSLGLINTPAVAAEPEPEPEEKNPVAGFNVQGAREDGYSDRDIAEYLASQTNFNLKGAMKDGYTPTEVIDHLVPPPPPPEPPAEDAEDSGITTTLKAGWKGLKQGFTDIAGATSAFDEKSLAEATPEERSKVNELLSEKIGEGWSDPTWWTANITHAIGGAAPIITGAAGSAYAVGKVTKNPYAALTAGAVGGGIAGFAQSLKPAYLAARADGLDHDAAVDRAMKDSGIAGAVATIMGLAPEISIFGRSLNGTANAMLKRPISEALAQTFVVQPGLMTAQQVATGQTHGKLPSAEELVTGYAHGVGMGVGMVGAHKAFKWAVTKPDPTAPPGRDTDTIPPGVGEGSDTAIADALMNLDSTDPNTALTEAIDLSSSAAEGQNVGATETGTPAQPRGSRGPLEITFGDENIGEPGRAVVDLTEKRDKLVKMLSSEEGTSVEQHDDGSATVSWMKPNGAPASAHIDVWNPEDAPPDGSKVTSTMAQDVEGAFKEGYGLNVVWLNDKAGVLTDGAFDKNQPDTIFLSNNPSRAITVLAGHEAGHGMEDIRAPDGRTMGEVLDEVAGEELTSAGWSIADRRFTASMPKRRAFGPAGAEGDEAHAYAIARHFINEMAKDEVANAHKSPAWADSVADKLQRDYGDKVAADMMGQLLTSVRRALTRIRNLFYRDTGEYEANPAVKIYDNIARVHDAIAEMAAKKLGAKFLADNNVSVIGQVPRTTEAGAALPETRAGPHAPVAERPELGTDYDIERVYYNDAVKQLAAIDAGTVPETKRQAFEALRDRHRARMDAIEQTANGFTEDEMTARWSVQHSPRQQEEDNKPFFSTLQRGVENAKTDKAPPGEWMGIIKNAPGVKDEEIAWSGVKEWLAAQAKPVTKADLLEHLRANDIELHDVTLGEMSSAGKEKLKALRPAMDDMVRKHAYMGFDDAFEARRAIAESPADFEYDTPADKKLAFAYSAAVRAARTKPTKYGDYTLPGGKDYHELLLTMPPRDIAGKNITNEDIRRGYRLNEKGEYESLPSLPETYVSSHFPAETNILAHVRFDTRTGPNGEKILHIAEIQSDWHQIGRKQGYKAEGVVDKLREAATIARHDMVETQNRLLKEASGGKYESKTDALDAGDKATFQKMVLTQASPEYTAAAEMYEKAVSALRAAQSGVPDAPFKTTWHELAMKRMLRYAVDHGYDRISWDVGETQAARYDLSKTISRIDWYKTATGKIHVDAYDHEGDAVVEKTMPPNEVADTIGKEHADRIVESKKSSGSFEGEGLKIGGEGMKGFYDKILRDFVNKYAKKWDAKTKTTYMTASEAQEGVDVPFEVFNTRTGDVVATHMDENVAHQAAQRMGPEYTYAFRNMEKTFPVHALDVTPAMRESVGKGQPKFSPRQSDKEERLGNLDIHTLDVDRGKRVVADATRLSQEEKTAISDAAKKYKLPRASIEEQVRAHKAANPVSAGWQPLVFDRLNPKLDKTGKVAVDKAGNPKVDYIYKEIPYTFQTGVDGKSLVKGTPEYKAKVTAVASGMRDEVRRIFEEAKAGSTNAKNIIAQSGWYRVMRTRLRHEFGGFGDLFADLLGATSPNTPVRGNWNYAVESLRRAVRGDYDNLLPVWLDRLSAIKAKEDSFRLWFNERLAAGETKNAIYKNPEYDARYDELSKLREWPDELLPLSEAGPKFGFNGGNVIRALVDLWRVVKPEEGDIGIGASKPKALNFSGNLIGFRSRATIDVWAARMLQRLFGEIRIPSMAEGGVTGDMLPSGETTGQFGFGQDTFAEAAAKIRTDPAMSKDPALGKINDDDLQALVWFIEKAEWTKLDATSVAGEGGSFEFEANLAGDADRARIDELRSIIGSRADENNAKKALDAFVADPEANAKLVRLHDRLSAAIEARDKFLEEKTAAPPEGSKKKQMASEQAKLLRGYTSASERIEAIKQTIADFIPNETEVLARKLADAKAERSDAKQELQSRVRALDRFTAGLSQQMSEGTQGVDFVPSNAEQASLANRMKTAIYSAGEASRVVASRVVSTMGRYFDDKERALDLEIVTRAGFDPSETQKQTLIEALRSRQDATFMSRVLREEEESLANPLVHRPGVEIYFRNADHIEKLESVLEGMRDPSGKISQWEATLAATAKEDRAEWLRDNPKPEGVNYYTVVIDAKLAAPENAGAMGKAVGVRFQYIPEFDARFGDETLSKMSDAELAAHVNAKADALAELAEDIRQNFSDVTYSQQLWYATDVRFNHEFAETIDGIDARKSEAGAREGGGEVWNGREIRAGLESANRQLRAADGRNAAPGEPGVVSGRDAEAVGKSPRLTKEEVADLDKLMQELAEKERRGKPGEPTPAPEIQPPAQTPAAPKPAAPAPREAAPAAPEPAQTPAAAPAAPATPKPAAAAPAAREAAPAAPEAPAATPAARTPRAQVLRTVRGTGGERERATNNAIYNVAEDRYQIDRANAFIEKHPDRALDIAMRRGGDHLANVHPEFIFMALEEKAYAEGDIALQEELSRSRIFEEITGMGQRISALRNRQKDSVVEDMRAINEARAARMKRKGLDVEKEAAARAEEGVKAARKEAKANKKPSLNEMIMTMICKV